MAEGVRHRAAEVHYLGHQAELHREGLGCRSQAEDLRQFVNMCKHLAVAIAI